jgi:hypothetical protein
MKGDVMGGTFSLDGRQKKSIYIFIGKSEGKTRLRDLRVSGKM